MSESVHKKRSIGRHACERCRKAKIRCLTSSLEEHGKCQKCLLNNQVCEWKEISKTRVRKRADGRVQELERQLSSLSAAMNDVRSQMDQAVLSRGSETSSVLYAQDESPSVQDAQVNARDADSGSNGAFLATSTGSLDPNDLPAETKSKHVEAFVTTMLPQCPVIAIPSAVDVDAMRHRKPFALRAVLTAACAISEPKSFRALHDYNTSLLSQAVVLQGRKSMDLLQALLITAIWSYPPDDLRNLNMYQWSHMACTMALELGLGGLTSLQAQAQSVSRFATDPSEAMMERCRTMAGVYLMCSRLAVSFRRQRMLSFSSSSHSMIEILRRHSQSINDRRLVAWLRLQSIAEDIESMKQNAGLHFDPAFIETSSIKSDLALFADRLKSWEQELDPVLWIESLRIDFGLCKSKLHELPIYYGEALHELDLPALTDRAQNLAANPQQNMSPRYIRALYSFIEDCQSILEVFLHADTTILRVLPILTMFRAPFAFKALAMLNRRAQDCDDNMSRVIDADIVGWDHYSRGVLEALQTASADKLYAYPSMALQIREGMLKSKGAQQQTMNSVQISETDCNAISQTAEISNDILDAAFWTPDLYNNPYMSFPPGGEDSTYWAAEFGSFDTLPF